MNHLLIVQVYQEGIIRLSMNCAKEAASRNVRLYMEFSSGQMYSSDKVTLPLSKQWTHPS